MAKMVIVGSGVVGQTTGKGFVKKGHDVTFVDINVDIIRKLSREGFEAYLPSELPETFADYIMFCVSTPPREDGSVNLDYVIDAVSEYARRLAKQPSYCAVVIRSTVPPGTTRKILLPLIEKHSGKKAGQDFGLCMQPEFLREKSSLEDFCHPLMTLIGEYDKCSGDALESLYGTFGGKKYRVSIETAEMVKYAHNLFLATKISFSNEIFMVCTHLGLDGTEIMEILSRGCHGMLDPSYGIKGGYPYGGRCLPKDTSGFLAYAKAIGLPMPLLEAVIKVNNRVETEFQQRGEQRGE